MPGVELYDTSADGSDVNIAVELVNEGHAKVIMNFGDLNRSHVLRLDGGSISEERPTQPSSTTSPDISSNFLSHEKANGTARSVSEPKTISVDVPAKNDESERLLQAEQTSSVEKHETVNSTTVSENNAGKLNGNGLLSRDWNELVEEEERKNPTLTH